MPTIPVVDPDIVATSATSGTLRYSAFSPVIAVIESPKTTLSVSRNATGKQHGVDERHGGARRPDEQSPGQHRRSATADARSEFSEWRCARQRPRR